jgi:hypothetical protein
MQTSPSRNSLFLGSRLQMLSYIQKDPATLNRAILSSIGMAQMTEASLEWVSPIESDGFAEYRDAEFLRHLGLSRLSAALAEYWPAKGPCWDALAVLHFEGGSASGGIILVESKSHRLETCGNGCGAANRDSIARIDAGFVLTQNWLGVKRANQWKSTLYQYSNRLAHLHFFRQVAQPAVNAWLINLYFLDDPYRPTSQAQWDDYLPEIKWALNLPEIVPFAADLFLPAIAP